jgi:hypothetical protein
MVKWIRPAVAILIEPQNLITIIGVIVAVILAYSAITTNNIQQALTAIITILGTQSVAQIITGYEISTSKKMVEETERLLRNFTLHKSTLRPRSELQSLPEMAKDAKDILIIARTAQVVLREIEFFKERMRRATNIRVAVINLDNTAIIEAIGQAVEIPIKGHLADIQSAKALINHLKEVSDSKRFQVRTFDYVPTLSFLIIDGNLKTGQMIIETIPYRVSPSMRPHLFMTAESDPAWYSFFRNIGESIWQDAKSF